MSLLAAFLAMLGKQWVNRYLSHTGGDSIVEHGITGGDSIVEHCINRQRKFYGLKKWKFRLVIESLPIMLQIALFLLACGLSRYMWSTNTSIACVVISLTTLSFLFFIGFVVAGAISYDCPFQTPLSPALRHLRRSAKTFNLSAWVEGRRSRREERKEREEREAREEREEREELLPRTIRGTRRRPNMPRTNPGLRVPVPDLKELQKRSADVVRCISWVL